MCVNCDASCPRNMKGECRTWDRWRFGVCAWVLVLVNADVQCEREEARLATETVNTIQKKCRRGQTSKRTDEEICTTQERHGSGR